MKCNGNIFFSLVCFKEDGVMRRKTELMKISNKSMSWTSKLRFYENSGCHRLICKTLFNGLKLYFVQIF